MRDIKDKEALAYLDKAVLWFGVERTIEILEEEYNQDFEGLRGEDSEDE